MYSLNKKFTRLGNGMLVNWDSVAAFTAALLITTIGLAYSQSETPATSQKKSHSMAQKASGPEQSTETEGPASTSRHARFERTSRQHEKPGWANSVIVASNTAEQTSATVLTKPIKFTRNAKPVKPAKFTKPSKPAEPAMSAETAEPEKSADPAKDDADEIAEIEAIDDAAPPAAPEPEAAIREAVAPWADAWSNQDVNAYLDRYAASFIPPGKMSRSTWEKQRKQRIQSPASIAIQLSDIEITFTEDGGASATFYQAYESPRYSDHVQKRLRFIREDGGWKISREE